MTNLLSKNLNLTKNANHFITKYIKYVKTINPNDVFEGKNDKQILRNKFIFKIQQITNLDSANISLHLTSKNIEVLAKIPDSKATIIGTYPLNSELEKMINHGAYPTIRITGGQYKEVVSGSFEDKISNGFEPYGIVLELHQPEIVNEKIKQFDKLYHHTFKNEQSLVNLSKILMSLFALIGLVLGIGFMFLGFLMTGLVVIIAFFGFNSYTLLLSNSYKPKQAN